MTKADALMVLTLLRLAAAERSKNDDHDVAIQGACEQVAYRLAIDIVRGIDEL